MTSKRDVEVALADHRDKLGFDWREDCVIITKPYDRSQKGKETWSKIMAIVRTELGGSWVSMGKDSHWVVPLEVVEEKQEGRPTESQPVIEKGNKGTYGTLNCPYCGERIDITFKPKKEAS